MNGDGFIQQQQREILERLRINLIKIRGGVLDSLITIDNINDILFESFRIDDEIVDLEIINQSKKELNEVKVNLQDIINNL